ncbi:uncharacterized protein LOC112138415, partial [Oryzias melastigma]|uniref:uncharacterized protein LOC112138415 n=1 Tax=Oryzias melastigma TaxID=30732 RepID=UPI000CF7FE38
MAFAATSSPPPFLPCPGEPSIPLDTWEKMFRNYLLVLAASGNEWPEERKKALLLHTLGTEGQRLFYTLPEQGTTMEDAMKALKAHFNPKQNAVAERHVFRKRAQTPTKSILHYVAALRDLAATCDFDDKQDEMIRDQLVEHLRSQRIRERLLLEADLALDTAVTLATQIEAATEQARLISTSTPTAPVAAVHMKPLADRRQFQKARQKTPPAPAVRNSTATSTSSRSCYRCGADKHLANSPKCPAAGVKCKNCQKVGHFARVCRSTQTRSVNAVDLPEVQILYLNNADSSDRIRCTATIKTASTSAPIQFTVDSGSSVSIISRSEYETHFSSDALQAPDVTLVTYSRSPIPVLGCLPTAVSHDDACYTTKLFVVDSGTTLLGMNLIKRLRLRFTGTSIENQDACADSEPEFVAMLSAALTA